jgi:Tfp pilus assembly protein PilF
LAICGFLAACAEQPAVKPAPAVEPVSAPAAPLPLTQEQAHARYQQGLLRFKENNPEAALDDLDAALVSGHLKTSEIIDAHKTIAFIHCAKGREAQCREHFQDVLRIDPKYELSANENANPSWNAVWRSMRGSADDKLAVAQGSAAKASPAKQKMAEGIKEYDAGNFPQAIASLQMALEKGLQIKADEIRTHKYLAFAYGLKGDAKLCRAEFHAIYALDKNYQLTKSEAGHPAWKQINIEEMALAKKPAKAPAAASTSAAASSSASASTPAAQKPAK